MIDKLTFWFQCNYDCYEGVRPIFIYCMWILFGLIILVLGNAAWGYVLPLRGPWEPYEGVAGLGLLQPLKMIPGILLVVICMFQSFRERACMLIRCKSDLSLIGRI